MRRATRCDVQVLRRPLPARQPVLRAAPRDVQGLGWRGSESKAAVHFVHATVVPLREWLLEFTESGCCTTRQNLRWAAEVRRARCTTGEQLACTRSILHIVPPASPPHTLSPSSPPAPSPASVSAHLAFPNPCPCPSPLPPVSHGIADGDGDTVKAFDEMSEKIKQENLTAEQKVALFVRLPASSPLYSYGRYT